MIEHEDFRQAVNLSGNDLMVGDQDQVPSAHGASLLLDMYLAGVDQWEFAIG